jgi:hypothetical protein
MKRIFTVSLLLFTAALLFAQQVPTGNAEAVGTQDPTQLQYGVDNSQLREISVEKFEVDGMWTSSISSDSGFSSTRLFDGGPANKTAITGEENLNIPDTKVLGTRVDFLRRGNASLTIRPDHPIPLEGITKTISLWVAGRNYNHALVLLIQDYFGRSFELEIGKLNFQGWKKLTVAIPPQADDGIHGIVQRNMHYANIGGIKILGLRVDFDPMEAYGSYFIYIDDMRAYTDLFAELAREPDDPNDDW